MIKIFVYLFWALIFSTTGFASSATWLRVDIGIVSPASEDILRSALSQAKKNGDEGVFVALDTPGGSLESTRAMVKDILGSDIPVVVWVGPDGSRAGSAGAFITIAAHVSAMAPGTNIGASHPIKADGGDIADKEGARKIENDTAAFIESIAKLRGKNVEMARSFVLTSASITAEEAMRNNVIDFIAKNPSELLEKINDRNVELSSGEKHVLKTKGATMVNYERSIKQTILEIVANPNLFYLLFLAGMIGLGFELTHPGALFPGVAGGICMILALIATSVLPVSFGGMLLLVAGVAFMIGEMFLPSFGVLGIGGFIAFVIGSFLLVDPNNESGLRLSAYVIAPGALVIGLTILGVGYLVLRSGRRKVMSGAEGMVGQEGLVIAEFSGAQGRVRVMGEDWSAVLDEPVPLKQGDKVKIVAVEGLKLRVKSVPT